jgi:hypothetical protein
VNIFRLAHDVLACHVNFEGRETDEAEDHKIVAENGWADPTVLLSSPCSE